MKTSTLRHKKSNLLERTRPQKHPWVSAKPSTTFLSDIDTVKIFCVSLVPQSLKTFISKHPRIRNCGLFGMSESVCEINTMNCRVIDFSGEG